MTTYRFYIGSTDTHDAHSRVNNVHRVTGVWEGTTENVAIETRTFDGDDGAMRYAATLARETGNACVLVVRDMSRLDVREYRVARWDTEMGNRTILPSGYAYRYVPDTMGRFTACLVNAHGSITSLRD